MVPLACPKWQLSAVPGASAVATVHCFILQANMSTVHQSSSCHRLACAVLHHCCISAQFLCDPVFGANGYRAPAWSHGTLHTAASAQMGSGHTLIL